MINAIKQLFGFGPQVDYKELMRQGATIVDVRTRAEYQQGHIRNSINIPLGDLAGGAKKLNKNKPVITCCASGMRSAQGKSILKSQGFANVHNGGGWNSLNNKLN
jgi:rhodanese-related sulfurtransferase